MTGSGQPTRPADAFEGRKHMNADALVEAIARRVVELLDERVERAIPAVELVDAVTVARALGVSRDTVYEHAEALGARRLGGARGRLRFDLAEAVDLWAARSSSERSQRDESPAEPAKPRRRREAGMGTSAPLLPIHGQSTPDRTPR